MADTSASGEGVSLGMPLGSSHPSFRPSPGSSLVPGEGGCWLPAPLWRQQTLVVIPGPGRSPPPPGAPSLLAPAMAPER